MASYVGGPYQYDVFISYAAAPPPIRNYAEAIYEELSGALEHKISVSGDGLDVKRSVPPSIYFDRDRAGRNEAHAADHLPDAIKCKLNRTATFVMLWSPFYLASKWCKQEREYWLHERCVGSDGLISVDMQRTFIPVWIEFKKDQQLHEADLKDIARRHFGRPYWPVAIDMVDPETREPVGLHAPRNCEMFKKKVASIASSLSQTLGKIKDCQLDVSDQSSKSSKDYYSGIVRLSQSQVSISHLTESGQYNRYQDQEQKNNNGRGIDLLPEPDRSDQAEKVQDWVSPSTARGIRLIDDTPPNDNGQSLVDYSIDSASKE